MYSLSFQIGFLLRKKKSPLDSRLVIITLYVQFLSILVIKLMCIVIPGVPDKAERWIKSIFTILLYSTLMRFILLDRGTFSHHHDPKIIKFGRKILIL